MARQIPKFGLAHLLVAIVALFAGYLADTARVKLFPAHGSVSWRVSDIGNDMASLQLSISGKNMCWMELNGEGRDAMKAALTFK